MWKFSLPIKKQKERHTFHFPPGEDEEGITQAEQLQQQIKDTGVLTGDIITEFSKEQGNFVTPRGKYTIQVR